MTTTLLDMRRGTTLGTSVITMTFVMGVLPAYSSTDITAQVIANQDITLNGDASVTLTGGVVTYAAPNGISGMGTLTINGAGTLVLEQTNKFSLPTVSQVVTAHGVFGTPKTSVYEGYNGPEFHGTYYTITGTDRPAVTINSGATLQLGDTKTSGTIVNNASGYNLDGILDNGLILVGNGSPSLSAISGTGSVVVRQCEVPYGSVSSSPSHGLFFHLFSPHLRRAIP